MGGQEWGRRLVISTLSMSVRTKSISRKVPSSSIALGEWYPETLCFPSPENQLSSSATVRGSRQAESGRERIWKCDGFLMELQTILLVTSASRVFFYRQSPDLLGVKLVGSWCSRVLVRTLLSELSQLLLIQLFSCFPIFIIVFSFLLTLSLWVYSLKYH